MCAVNGRGGRTTEIDVHRFITGYLHKRKVCAKLVPKNLSDEQKDNRVLVSRELVDRVTS